MPQVRSLRGRVTQSLRNLTGAWKCKKQKCRQPVNGFWLKPLAGRSNRSCRLTFSIIGLAWIPWSFLALSEDNSYFQTVLYFLFVVEASRVTNRGC